ncbi:MAG: hypothetical protein JXA07_03720 [Spirochaetes bacterium]|nr:hypothetical protein [Spirochaetota bacterium]
MYKILPHLLALSIILSCSGQMDAMLPKSLDEKGDIRLVKRYDEAEARRLFDRDPAINAVLNEFSPAAISAGAYKYRGIKIHLGMARCTSTDDAFGIYSALTAMPRDRWIYGKGEMSYRPPYVSGYNGEFVFWIYSPTNPSTYTVHYKLHGERMLAEFEKASRAPDASYHWKILPEENRYADSLFFIRDRIVNGVEVKNAYGATYQMQYNVAKIYAMRFGSPTDAAVMCHAQKRRLGKEGKKLVRFVPVPGAPIDAVYWKETGGTWALCQYRWMVFLFQDMPTLESTNNFTRLIFRYMMKIRKEVVKKTAK